jgi:hypothetical protein
MKQAYYAYFNVFSVSSLAYLFTQAINKVIEFPPRDCFNILVNFEFL